MASGLAASPSPMVVGASRRRADADWQRLRQEGTSTSTRARIRNLKERGAEGAGVERRERETRTETKRARVSEAAVVQGGDSKESGVAWLNSIAHSCQIVKSEEQRLCKGKQKQGARCGGRRCGRGAGRPLSPVPLAGREGGGLVGFMVLYGSGVLGKLGQMDPCDGRERGARVRGRVQGAECASAHVA